MASPRDKSCPFCGARLAGEPSACPACDLPLLGEDGEHPPTRSRAPFDGASLFDEAFPDDAFEPAHLPDRRLMTERRSDIGQLRCVVVAINQAEAEMLCDMLRAEGLRSMVRSPDLQSYGQTSLRCEVLVPEEDLSAARDLLRIEPPSASAETTAPHLFTIGVMVFLVAVAAAVALLIAFAS